MKLNYREVSGEIVPTVIEEFYSSNILLVKAMTKSTILLQSNLCNFFKWGSKEKTQ